MTDYKSTAIIFATLAGCCIVASIVFSVAEISFPTLVLSFLAIFFVAAGFFFGRKQMKEDEKALTARASFVSPANTAVQDALAAYEAYQNGVETFLPDDQLEELKQQSLTTAKEMVAALQDISVSQKALALASLQTCRDRLQEAKNSPSEEDAPMSQELQAALFQLLEDLKDLAAEKTPTE